MALENSNLPLMKNLHQFYMVCPENSLFCEVNIILIPNSETTENQRPISYEYPCKNPHENTSKPKY
jgi:hypothetical protein